MNDLPSVPCSHGSFMNQQKLLYDAGERRYGGVDGPKAGEALMLIFPSTPSLWLVSLLLFSLLWLVSVLVAKGYTEAELSKWSLYLDSLVNPTYPQMRLSKHSPQPWMQPSPQP